MADFKLSESEIDLLKVWVLDCIEYDVDSDECRGEYEVSTVAHPFCKYVVALVKKDKPLKALKEICQEQLSAFFPKKNQLEKFINELFQALETRSFTNVKSSKNFESILTYIYNEENRSQELESTMSTLLRVDSYENEETERSRRRSPSPDNRRRRSRSRSRSPDRRRHDRDRRRRRHSPRSRRSPSPRDRRSRSPRDRRSPDRDRKISSIVTLVNPKKDSDESYHDRRRDRGTRKKCKDYFEKGFCLKGDSCPYEHDVNPVVIEEPQLRGGMFNDASQPLIVPNSSNYNQYSPFQQNISFQSRSKRQLEDSEPENPKRHTSLSSTSILLTSVPKEMNNIMRIGEFFGKYGTIKNVSVSYMGDNSKALVEFSTPQEAKTAVFDQEYVMGDKAIGKIWNDAPQRTSVQERLGFRSDMPPPSNIPSKPQIVRDLRSIPLGDNSSASPNGAPSFRGSRYRNRGRSSRASIPQHNPSMYARHSTYTIPTDEQLQSEIAGVEKDIQSIDESIELKKQSTLKEENLLKKLISQRKTLKTKLESSRDSDLRMEIQELSTRTQEAMVECTKRKHELEKDINALEGRKKPHYRDLSFLKVQEEMQSELVNKELDLEGMKKEGKMDDIGEMEQALHILKEKLQRHMHARILAAKKAQSIAASIARGRAGFRSRSRGFRSRGGFRSRFGSHLYKSYNAPPRETTQAMSPSGASGIPVDPNYALNLDEPVYDDDDDDDELLMDEAGLNISTDDLEDDVGEYGEGDEAEFAEGEEEAAAGEDALVTSTEE